MEGNRHSRGRGSSARDREEEKEGERDMVIMDITDNTRVLIDTSTV